MTDTAQTADVPFKRFAVVMLALYAEEAKRRLEAAEELVVKALEERDTAQAMLARAEELSSELARHIDAGLDIGTELEEDDIAW